MKKIKQVLFGFTLSIMLLSKSVAQVSTAFNIGAATNFVGWNSGQLFPLRIEHQGSQPINFSTNGTQKATLLVNGNFGLGIAAPNYKYHLNTAADADVFQQFTNSASGTTVTDGFRLGIFRGSLIAELHQFENASMDFYTNNLRYGQLTNTGNFTLSDSWPYTPNSVGRMLFDDTNYI